MKVKIERLEEVDARAINICLKVRDCFSADLIDDKGNHLCSYEGYVPPFMPGEHYGDYVELNIDIETGVILNWNKPTKSQIEQFITDSDK